MKQFLIIVICFINCIVLKAQISQEDYNKLPEDVKAQITASLQKDPVKENLVKTSEYASLGHQIGVAVNETLKALEETAVNLSETRIGKIAIIIVIWKLLGKDIIYIVFGIAFIICVLILLTKTFKRWKEITSGEHYMSDGESFEIFFRIIACLAFFISGMFFITI